MYLEYREKKKIHKILTTSPKIWTLPLTKISYTNPPPMSMTTLISKTTHPFSQEWQRVSILSRHLIIARWASISILIIIVGVIVIVLGCLERRRRRLHEATKVSLSSRNRADMGVHLIQLITKSIKASIHALKLPHDRIKSYTTHRRKGSEGGWSWRSGRNYHLCLGPPRSELCLTPSNGSNVYGTYHGKMRRNGKGNGKIEKNLSDSRRKNELIMGHHIPIDIYKR